MDKGKGRKKEAMPADVLAGLAKKRPKRYAVLPKGIAKLNEVNILLAQGQTIVNCFISLGWPVDNSKKTILSLLAVFNVVSPNAWTGAVAGREYRLTTREIIAFANVYFESIVGDDWSSGSYDDVRRKFLLPFHNYQFLLNVGKDDSASVNAPNRGYCLNETFLEIIRAFNDTQAWKGSFTEAVKPLRPSLAHNTPLSVTLPNGTTLALTAGGHNMLQIAIIQHFIPRFCHNGNYLNQPNFLLIAVPASLLYVADTSAKSLYTDVAGLTKLGMRVDVQLKVPDIIVYSPGKNWLFLIEAVHSYGPITQIRREHLAKFCAKFGGHVIYVTAFAARPEWKSKAADIAWETEVWIASEPKHIIHYNGDKYLGPAPAEEDEEELSSSA